MTIRITQGHVLDCLSKIPDKSIHCCITSPPYYKVRAFWPETQIWGADNNCNHNFILNKTKAENYTQMYNNRIASQYANQKPQTQFYEMQGHCENCGAWQGNLGSEPTPAQWLKNIGQIFKEVHRVLRDDGTLWLNLGDRRAAQKTDKIKPKDLFGLPFAAAFLLRDMGWYLRSSIIIAKESAMPETQAIDRPISSYEFLFLLTKTRTYYYDKHAIHNFNVTDVWRMGHEYSPSLKHYGNFPKELPRRCVLLSTSPKGVCPECKAPYIRVKTTTEIQNHSAHVRLPKTRTIPTKEWIPSCKCNAGSPVPATVLDCFAGTGTTGLVAELLSRDSIMIELSEDWVKTMKTRLSRDGGLLVNIQEYNA